MHSRSPIQIASYMSTVFSIGCIVMGLLLVRQPGKDGSRSQWNTASVSTAASLLPLPRTPCNADHRQVFQSISDVGTRDLCHPIQHSLFPLDLLVSLLYPFMTFSILTSSRMVAFSVAFGWNCFQNSNTPTTAIVAVAWSIPIIFSVCCVWARWTSYSNGFDKSGLWT